MPGKWRCKGGKFSRAKGGREERGLVQELIELGYQHVRRMPLQTHYNRDTGEAKHHQDKGDVLGEKEGKEYSFELKTRNNLFQWIYDFMDSTSIKRFSYLGKCVSYGVTPAEAEAQGFDNPFISIVEDDSNIKIYKRLIKLELLKKKADFLVVKNNRRRRLYFKFW